ncbi:MAG: acyl-CoA thioesterase [Synergistaceae bacterium]|jgi:acyl-CoA thioester hydrolase|nr:acyl-CoA thioesterase [Synergistaceae bacterium]
MDDDTFIQTCTARVRYSETDKMGIVYNANYLIWFEMARTEYCRNMGKTYRGWEAQGYFLPVTESYCRYRYPANYDDLVVLYCRAPVEQIKPSSILFEYRVMVDSELLAEGWTKHAFVNAEGRIYRKNNQFQMWLLEEAGKREIHQ